jgi:hypothetical protein
MLEGAWKHLLGNMPELAEFFSKRKGHFAHGDY